MGVKTCNRSVVGPPRRAGHRVRGHAARGRAVAPTAGAQRRRRAARDLRARRRLLRPHRRRLLQRRRNYTRSYKPSHAQNHHPRF